MCGLFGSVGKADQNKLKILALLNESRGNHSTGFYTKGINYKSIEGASEALTSKVFKQGFSNVGDYSIGHTRYATHGEKTVENAHPFHIGHIVGAHNGIISNFKAKQDKQGTKYQVDSQIIFHLLDNLGLKGLQHITGYWSLLWIDFECKNKYFITRSHNELYMLKSGNCLYISSDKQHLEVIKQKGDSYINISENVVYEIDTRTLKLKKIFKYMPKKEVIQTKNWREYPADTESPFYDEWGRDEYKLNAVSDQECDFCTKEIKSAESYSLYDNNYIVCKECSTDLLADGYVLGKGVKECTI